MPNALFSPDQSDGFSQQIVELRETFDQTFAVPPMNIRQSGELVLAILVGTNRYGLRLSEIAGIHRCPKIVPVPGMKASCLGLIGLRGHLHAAFHLGLVLNRSDAPTTPRWLVLAPGKEAPAFAIDAVEACLTLQMEDFRAIEQQSEMGSAARSLFIHQGIARELLHFPSLVARVVGSGSSP